MSSLLFGKIQLQKSSRRRPGSPVRGSLQNADLASGAWMWIQRCIVIVHVQGSLALGVFCKMFPLQIGQTSTKLDHIVPAPKSSTSRGTRHGILELSSSCHDGFPMAHRLALSTV